MCHKRQCSAFLPRLPGAYYIAVFIGLDCTYCHLFCTTVRIVRADFCSVCSSRLFTLLGLFRFVCFTPTVLRTLFYVQASLCTMRQLCIFERVRFDGTRVVDSTLSVLHYISLAWSGARTPPTRGVILMPLILMICHADVHLCPHDMCHDFSVRIVHLGRIVLFSSTSCQCFDVLCVMTKSGLPLLGSLHFGHFRFHPSRLVLCLVLRHTLV